MDPREELTALRRMAELEAKASGQVSSGVPVGRQGVTGIPTEPGANLTPTAAPERSMFERAMGNIETIPAMVGGAVGGVVAPIAQLGYELTQGQAFTPQGKAAAAQFGQQVQQQFYQPRTPEAQRNVQAIGEMVPPFAGLRMGGPTGTLAPAARAVGDVARAEGQLVGGAVNQALAGRAARIQEARATESYANAPQIEAAQTANKLGIALNPAVSNPTPSNKMKSMIAGTENLDVRLAKVNENKWADIVRKDMDLPANTVLDAKAIETALNKQSAPYEAVRKIYSLAPDADVVQSIESLRGPALIGGEASAAAVSRLIDDAVNKINQGRSGALVVDDIRQLRREAQSVYKSRDRGNNPPPSDVAAADARMGIANALEDLIDTNVRDPKVIAELQAARTKMAQIYEHERALDFATGKIDPQVYAKMLSEGKPMTGVGADIGKIAANFPAVSTIKPGVEARAPRVTRGSVGGAIGGAVGSLAGPLGAAAGAITGATIGGLSSAIGARRVATPAYQAAKAVPTDYRPPVNMLRPVEPNVVTNGLVPYTTPVEVLMPGQGTTFGRNFTMQGEPAFDIPTPFAQRSLPNPVPGQIYQAQKNAELAQEFRAAAERKPTGAGSVLEFDPITGTYKVGGAGVKGATPEIFQADTGASLKSATDKVAAGKLFDLDAAEKVAWEKTKVDLAAVDPGLTKLSDKAVAAKMMDRQWIADTIQKVKDKAIANEAIAARATTERARQTALMEREKLMGQLADLEDRFSKSRPVQKGGQGPKTRAFQRNMLTPEQEIQNALSEPTYRVEIRGTSTSGKK
jgi:hypothetical protein